MAMVRLEALPNWFAMQILQSVPVMTCRDSCASWTFPRDSSHGPSIAAGYGFRIFPKVLLESPHVSKQPPIGLQRSLAAIRWRAGLNALMEGNWYDHHEDDKM